MSARVNLGDDALVVGGVLLLDDAVERTMRPYPLASSSTALSTVAAATVPHHGDDVRRVKHVAGRKYVPDERNAHEAV